MVACEICRKTVQSSDKVVKCNGPCTGVYHMFCADLNMTYGRALASKVGLYWFCGRCRVVLDQQKVASNKAVTTLAELSKRLDAMEKALGKGNPGEDSINSGMVSVSPLELLPVEIWTKVFRSLNGFQLRQIRMACRSWNHIVGDSSTLMNKLLLRLPKNVILDGECKEIEVLSSSKSRYSSIVMEQIRIIGVNSWWTSVAEHLEALTINKCQITIVTLLTMLEPLHNLKKLSFTCGPYVDARSCPTKVNFNLPSLESLILLEVDHGDLLDVFRQIYPRLREFKLPTGSCPETHPQKVIKLIETTKNTLQEVELPMVQRLWQSLNAIGGVHLKGISLTACHEQAAMNEYHLNNLCQKHPGVETLFIAQIIKSYETMLEMIKRYLPNLKRLQICVQRSTNAASSTFLNQMLDLAHLHIKSACYYNTTFDITNCRNNSLKFLTLEYLKISNSFSNAFPYISHLTLTDCTIKTWSFVFDSNFKYLQHVTLKSVRVEKSEECLADYLQKLKYLNISNCSMNNLFLVALFSLCPKLEEVKLDSETQIKNNVISTIIEKLSNLKKITVTNHYSLKNSQELMDKLRGRLELCHFSNGHTHNRTYSDEYYTDHYTDSEHSD